MAENVPSKACLDALAYGGYTRKNRINHSKIRLMQSVFMGCQHRYSLFCLTHFIDGPRFNTKSEATHAMAHPWLWCAKCKEDGIQECNKTIEKELYYFSNLIKHGWNTDTAISQI